MRKTVLLLMVALSMPVASALGQSYASLWKQVDDADGKDLPQTKIGVLRQIEAKAEKEKNYGQLLKASLQAAQTATYISSDSLRPAVERLVQRERKAGDAVLKAVYDVVLYRIYNDNAQQLGDDAPLEADGKAKAESYRAMAMANAQRLAATKTSAYVPFVVKGSDSNRMFDDDMLSVVGYETANYKALADHYHKKGNRRAACLAALEYVKTLAPAGDEDYRKSEQLHRLDSLTTLFGDLDVAGEVAVERYLHMRQCRGVTAEDQIGYIRNALDRWGGWIRANELRNAERSLTTPQYNFALPNRRVAARQRQTVALSDVRNLKSITMRIGRTTLDGATTLRPYNRSDLQKIKSGMTPLPELTQTRTFLGKADYQTFSDSMAIGGLPPGVYLIEMETSPSTETQRKLYFVSDVYAVALPMPGNQTRYSVVDITTGQPIGGASLRLSQSQGYGKPPRQVTLTCDTKGEATYTYKANERPYEVFAYTATDKAAPVFNTYGRYNYNSDSGDKTRTVVFTDKAIYRPGQTVRMAAVTYRNSGGDDNNAVAGLTVKARLMDANGKTLAEKQLATDGFGTCSADFALPQSALTGRFQVVANGTSATFSVEEYKRPTFQVVFPKVNERYQNGDTLTVKAKAASYAGAPVQGAKVKYAVRRKLPYWWLGCMRHCAGAWDGGASGDVTLYEGETTTADDGSFTVAMPMTLPDESLGKRAFYNFSVLADVTDAAGETHSGSLTLPLGTRPTTLSADIDDKVLADSLKSLTFHLRNAAGLPISAEVSFSIDNTTATALTGEPFALAEKLKSGKHRLFAVCEGDTLERHFTVFSLDDTTPCTATDDWFYVSADRFATDGKPVTVQAGASADSLHIIYMLTSGDKTLESGTLDKHGQLENRKLKYLDSYGDGILLAYAWVKNGQMHSHTAQIRRPQTDKTLRLEWSSFRDRLTPGQREEWTLRIKTPDGKPAKAQLLATLYDKSLDQIKQHDWTFDPLNRLHLPSVQWQSATNHQITGSGIAATNYLTVSQLSLSHFDASVFPNTAFYYAGRGVLLGLQKHSASRVAKPMMLAAKAYNAANMDMAVEAKAEPSAADKADTPDNGMASGDGETTEQVRGNMNETPFFQPTLQAGNNGEVTMRFTLPESLTTWRFMGFAHTADMRHGQIGAEAVASKQLMVQPNVPRFVRVGDAATIAAKIYNASATPISGTARMELIDPTTEKTVCSTDAAFSADADKTAAVAFSFIPNESQSLLVCRITASGSGFSDGEQHYLPVLPNSERVTATVPFVQHSQGTKTILLAQLFPTGSKQRKLTIEYTNNPAWLALQALPSLGVAASENAIDQCAALYANTLGAALMNSSPRISGAFESWRRERGNATSLASGLASNQELKDIVLDETPWLAEADKEAEQKARLGEFFDTSLMEQRRNAAAEKLASLQNADGSWSWWRGMGGSQSMTVAIAEMLVRLNAMAGTQQLTASMIDKAMAYADGETVAMVTRMRSEERKGHKQHFPGFSALQYLYLRVMAGGRMTAEVRSACDYLVALMTADNKSQSIQEKALAAIILAKHGNKDKAAEYAKSLKEYSVCTDEAGRYYDTQRAAYSWCDYKIPTEVAAIEALLAVTPGDTATIGEMRRWLLHEKRTQMWDTPINSVNAIYALLAGNAKALDAGAPTAMAIDGTPIGANAPTAGMGYVKTAITNPAGNRLSFDKTSAGTSWGAVYAQYMQPTSAIGQSGSGIAVKREVIAPSGKLAVGDRIKVRITIDAKRDFDFVQVADRRAACMEPVGQLSAYANGAYRTPKDNATYYYFSTLPKGKHVVETEYHIDREGRYETGTCTVGCAYAPEYRATAKSITMEVGKRQ